jgi:hypothetical protein
VCKLVYYVVDYVYYTVLCLRGFDACNMESIPEVDEMSTCFEELHFAVPSHNLSSLLSPSFPLTCRIESDMLPLSNLF